MKNSGFNLIIIFLLEENAKLNLLTFRLYFKRTQYIKLTFGIKRELITDVYNKSYAA